MSSRRDFPLSTAKGLIDRLAVWWLTRSGYLDLVSQAFWYYHDVAKGVQRNDNPPENPWVR